MFFLADFTVDDFKLFYKIVFILFCVASLFTWALYEIKCKRDNAADETGDEIDEQDLADRYG